ncbi:UDP-galactose transporter Gms1 [Friedmanniomyces endolithicus]|uniref:UDP-galactose transporter Gms1 n=1 Tax=Friedmanniomyces endolithicus TaxID=329885 RepID=A0AAN6HAR0_9PEZI|nr:UDP-galactose transporter Gms1 [Friedmanniomyces endolithicus]KAK0962531.1 UDP-galactose transporter Gms1 [Friedmanniomyces endolithicus]KAK0984317.1 UDP-galactose transporter Gms1 [Friedmanniomyces endolithicus]KAK1010499.1 UDP-galactose transporter Gms1 [Friedmanniomyces endolithicus]
MPLVDRPPYYISTAVFLSEVIKLVTSLSLALYDIARDPHTLDDLTVTGLFTKLGQVVFTSDSWKMALPAIPQTTLQYIGVSNLDAATFQVPSQLEMLVTAELSVTMLGRSLGMLLDGIVVALVVNYADSITTNPAASISTIVIILASVALFDFRITFTFLLGTSVVLFATYLHSSTAEDETQPPPIYTTDEKSGEQSYSDLESTATPTYERRPKLQTPGVCR